MSEFLSKSVELAPLGKSIQTPGIYINYNYSSERSTYVARGGLLFITHIKISTVWMTMSPGSIVQRFAETVHLY